jgi:hypothetical protein
VGEKEFLFSVYSGDGANHSESRLWLDPNNLDASLASLDPRKLDLLRAAMQRYDSEHKEAAPTGLFSYARLMKELENMRKPEAVIDGFLREGEITILAGKPKEGKSRLILQAALSIATGQNFLGLRVPAARRVLVVDFENRPHALRDRLMRLTGTVKSDIPNLFLWCASSLATEGPSASSEGIARLAALVDEVRADVLFIDPLRLFLRGDETNPLAVLDALRATSSLCESRPTLATGFIHHVRKQKYESRVKLLADPHGWIENLSGHFGLVAHADSVFGLERDGDAITLAGVARNSEAPTLILTEDPETLAFSVQQGDAVLEQVLTSKEMEFWGLAKTFGRAFTFSQLVAKAGTTNKKAVASALRKLQDHGHLRRLESGGYEVISPASEETEEKGGTTGTIVQIQ